MGKTVYVRAEDDVQGAPFCTRVATARQYGDVVVGIVTDRALAQVNRPARLDFEGRQRIVLQMDGVARVVAQEDFDGLDTLRRLQPDVYVCDLDDGVARNPGLFLASAGEWQGEVIAASQGPAGSEVCQVLDIGFGVTPAFRLRQLRRLLTYSGLVRTMEVHSPLCGIIIETAAAERDGQMIGFDAMWSSSLTDATVRGKPDNEVVDHSTRLAGLNELFDVTTKPMLYDADTGGKPEHFAYTVRSLERLGVSAVVIEDKIGLKRNSLLGERPGQEQESIDNFCHKISTGKAAQATKDFAVIGRIESLILNAGLEDALERARAYANAGADGLMIHSRSKEPEEIFSFCNRFRRTDGTTALVVAPTSYSGVRESELQAHGVNVVIYANHLLRAAYPAMLNAAQTILAHGRCREAEALCMPVDALLRLIPQTSEP